jgi:hypothetical protein
MICVHWENCRAPDVMIFKTATAFDVVNDGYLIIHNGNKENVVATFPPGIWKVVVTSDADVEPKQGQS